MLLALANRCSRAGVHDAPLAAAVHGARRRRCAIDLTLPTIDLTAARAAADERSGTHSRLAARCFGALDEACSDAGGSTLARVPRAGLEATVVAKRLAHRKPWRALQRAARPRPAVSAVLPAPRDGRARVEERGYAANAGAVALRYGAAPPSRAPGPGLINDRVAAATGEQDDEDQPGRTYSHFVPVGRVTRQFLPEHSTSHDEASEQSTTHWVLQITLHALFPHLTAQPPLQSTSHAPATLQSTAQPPPVHPTLQVVAALQSTTH